MSLTSMFSTPTGGGLAQPSKPAYTAPATMNWANPQGGLSQDIMDYLRNNQVPNTVPQGQRYAGLPQIGINGAGSYVLPGGNAAFGTKPYGVVSGSQDGGYSYVPMNGQQKNATNYMYNPDGSFNYSYKNTPIMSPAAGLASVVGAGLGFGAIGALAAGGAGAAGLGEGANIGAANALSDAAAYNSLPGTAFAPSTGGLSTATMGAGAAGLGGASEVAPGVFNPAVDSQLASSQLGITGTQAAAGAAVPSVTVNGVPGMNNFLPSTGGLSLGQIGQGAGALNSLLGGNGQGGLAQVLGGFNDAAQREHSSQSMINWLNQQQSKVDNLYAPGSPEFNQLWDQMSRTDAAAGRNSQYGPRAVDLAAKIAQIKADNTVRLTAGSARGMADALTQQSQARSFPGLMSTLGQPGTINSLRDLFGLGGASTGNDFVTPNPFYNGGSSDAGTPLPYAGPDNFDISDWWA
jgi:hypothetical protein